MCYNAGMKNFNTLPTPLLFASTAAAGLLAISGCTHANTNPQPSPGDVKNMARNIQQTVDGLVANAQRKPSANVQITKSGSLVGISLSNVKVDTSQLSPAAARGYAQTGSYELDYTAVGGKLQSAEIVTRVACGADANNTVSDYLLATRSGSLYGNPGGATGVETFGLAQVAFNLADTAISQAIELGAGAAPVIITVPASAHCGK